MRPRTLAMSVLVVAQFMDLMDAMITNVALPTIRDDLGASQAQLEWTLTGYILSFAVVLITGGRLGDIIGRRRTFMIGIAVFTLASLTAAMSQSGGQLVASRICQGTAAALMVPQVLATAQALYEPHERGKVFGLMSALGGIGVLTGQLLGGWLVTADLAGLGWRSIFLINLPVGLMIMVAAHRFVPETRADRAPRLDVPGVVLATTTLFLLVFPLTVGNSAGWPVWVWGMLLASTLSLAWFLRVEHRQGQAALLPLSLFTQRGFAAGSVVQLSYQVGWGSFALMLGLYVQESLAFTPLQAGLTMAPVTLGSFLGTALAPVAARIGRVAVIVGALVQAAAFGGYGWAILVAGADLNIWSLAVPLGLAGIGMILLAVPLMGLTLERVPNAAAGAASGTFAMFQQLGYALGIAIVGVVFFGIIGSLGSQETYRRAIVTGNWITIAAFGLASLAAFMLPKRTASQATQVPAPQPVND